MPGEVKEPRTRHYLGDLRQGFARIRSSAAGLPKREASRLQL